MLSKTRLTVALSLLAGLVAMAPLARADEFSAAQKAEMGKIIHDYLVQNPEVLREAITALDQKQKAQESAQRGAAMDSIGKSIFDSKYQAVIGNPAGKVTLVEFFDYNCGYCKKSLSDVSRLTKENPDLRVVLKDFPVLGPGSVEAAQVAGAVRNQLDGDKFWAFHQKLLSSHGHVGKEQALAAAKDAGVDMNRLQKDMQGKDVREGIDEVMQIADKLSLTGTPSWVVGKDVVVGAVGYDELNGKIANLKKCGKTSCG